MSKEHLSCRGGRQRGGRPRRLLLPHGARTLGASEQEYSRGSKGTRRPRGERSRIVMFEDRKLR